MKVNGRTVSLGQEQTLAAFLDANKYDGKTVAVECNGAIVPRAEYGSVALTDDDVLEIVTFVGGG